MGKFRYCGFAEILHLNTRKEGGEAIFSKEIITEEERIEIETLCALAIELIKSASPFRLREAGRLIEIRHLAKKEK